MGGPLARFWRFVQRHQSFLAVALTFVAIGYTNQRGRESDASIKHAAQAQTAQVQRAGIKNRKELCRSIDSDHNRQRGDIIRSEALLYKVPEFHALIPSRASENAAYQQAKYRYEQIRRSRPSFCNGLVSNPVPPFPPLASFRQDGKP